MIFAGRTQMLWDRHSLSDSLRIIRNLGFEGAEICLENKHFECVMTYLEDYVIEHTRELCQELGLRANSVGCHIDFVHDDDHFTILKEAIPKIPRFGTHIFVIGACRRIGNYPHEWETYGKRMAEMVKIAEDIDVTLAPEPEIHCVLRTSQDMLSLLETIQSPALRVNLDIGHAFLTDVDPLESIRMLGGRIAHLHIENMYRGWHNHQLPMVGDMDLEMYFKVIREIDFEGPAALDLYNVDLQEVAPQVLEYLNSIRERAECKR